MNITDFTPATQWEGSVDGCRFDPEAGLATAEYAVATIGAVAFAGLLIAIMRSDTVRSALEGLINGALSGF